MADTIQGAATATTSATASTSAAGATTATTTSKTGAALEIKVPTHVTSEQVGVLVSRLSSPVTVSYGDTHIRVSPRSVSKPLVRRLLGALPAGVSFVSR